MKDLLIVYSRPAHNSYVAGQCGFLGENGISADAFLLTYDNMIFIPKRKSPSPPAKVSTFPKFMGSSYLCSKNLSVSIISLLICVNKDSFESNLFSSRKNRRK